MDEMLWVKITSHPIRGLISVSIKPAMLTEITSGWCNRHQREYNYRDCETHKGSYLCPDCLMEDYDKPLTIGSTSKAYEWR
jgi:hypothetical protein